ncbi:MAG: hypothetical protein MJZ33_10620 [Paludibacteraceae bacterium]|nr:hypothetical protein [Paludibacteraceae bacterium]
MNTLQNPTKVDVITNAADSVIANIGDTSYDGDFSKQIVAEYWHDEGKFVIYTEVFDEEDNYIGSEDCSMFSHLQLKEIENQLRIV